MTTDTRTLDVVTVDPMDDRPVYKQIADWIREQIDRGDLRPGDRLPSETELLTAFAASRSTVRHALEQLTNEGHVQPLRGRGVFVRPQIQPRRLIIRDPSNFVMRQRDLLTRPMIEDAEAQGFAYTQRIRALEEVPAPRDVAADLQVEPGTPVFVRRRLVLYRGDDPGSVLSPAKLADSYLPIDIAVGRIRQPDTGRGGTFARIAESGHRLTHFVERVLFRMPHPDESRLLRLGAGIPVIDQTRVAYAGERPVEVFKAVLAGDRHELEYRIPAR